MSPDPLVTVLMPVYNAHEFLRPAIDSILNQSYENFEFIIINDGSTDQSEDIILSYQDPRIKYKKNKQNIKLIATLNNGLELAKGKYVVRMDADDVSMPQRIERQVNLMESNPSIELAGSWYDLIGDICKTVRYESDLNTLRFKMLYQTQFCHPSVIIRKSLIEKIGLLFDPAYLHAEDYDFFSRVAYNYPVTNIPEVLLQYRIHQTNVSVLYKNVQIDNSRKVMISNFERIGIHVNSADVDLFEKLAYQNYDALKDSITELEALLLQMINVSPLNETITHPFLLRYAVNAWFALCYNLINKVDGLPKLFFHSEITRKHIPAGQKIRFKLKSLLG